jgi:poly-gamma-glutamate synthesis protein (capsule biosynthesis protein)
MILAGDVNLMNVADPAAAFALIRGEFAATDLVFANLECCLYRPLDAHSCEHEGFYAAPAAAGEALRRRVRGGRHCQQRQLRRRSRLDRPA